MSDRRFLGVLVAGLVAAVSSAGGLTCLGARALLPPSYTSMDGEGRVVEGAAEYAESLLQIGTGALVVAVACATTAVLLVRAHLRAVAPQE